jgi:hypothetical protein
VEKILQEDLAVARDGFAVGESEIEDEIEKEVHTVASTAKELRSTRACRLERRGG